MIPRTATNCYTSVSQAWTDRRVQREEKETYLAESVPWIKLVIVRTPHPKSVFLLVHLAKKSVIRPCRIIAVEETA